MNRPSLCRASLLMLAATAAARSSAAPAVADEARRPNIVLILADDLGINDLGCYGRKEHSTPNLDRLASQGVRFTSAYCAQPICSASRAGLLTGLSPARLHLTTFLPGRPDSFAQKLLHPKIEQQLALEYTTLAEHLQSAGYATACIGKWHLGGRGFGPEQQGFDFAYEYAADTQPSGVTEHRPERMEGGKGEYGLTRKAIRVLELQHQKDASQPFFLYLAHHNPHIPLLARFELTNKHEKAFNPLYAAVVETLDETVGLLLNKLDELKLADNTIVIFLSDNGGLHVAELRDAPPTHNTPFRAGKGFVYEGGLRVPAIVRYPGIAKAGHVTDTPITGTDWTPTLLKLCGAEPEKVFDGVDITPALQGEDLPPRPLFWHFPHYTNQGSKPAAAMRAGDWKLIEHYEDGRLELFNLAEDAGEQHDLAKAQPERVAAMHQQLDAWRKEVDAQMNQRNPEFDILSENAPSKQLDVSNLKPAATAKEMLPQLKAWREQMDAAIGGPRSAFDRYLLKP